MGLLLSRFCVFCSLPFPCLSSIEWESVLLRLGLIPPQPASAPVTSQRQQKLSFHASTIPAPSANELPPSPPQTQSPTKRTHSGMSTGSPLPFKPIARRSSDLSAEARVRRNKIIEAALAESGKDNETPAAPHAQGPDPSIGEETVRGNYYRESDSSDEEYVMPAYKRTRFVIKTEEEEVGTLPAPQVIPCTPPRRVSRLSISLPTPEQTSERRTRTVTMDEYSNATPPASPTSFTKGAKRAQEKAREREESGSNQRWEESNRIAATVGVQTGDEGTHVSPVNLPRSIASVDSLSS